MHFGNILFKQFILQQSQLLILIPPLTLNSILFFQEYLVFVLTRLDNTHNELNIANKKVRNLNYMLDNCI